MQASPLRRRIATVLLGLGGSMMAFGVFAPPAHAGGDEPAVYTSGHDSYLHGPHRGSAPGDADNTESCPEDEEVDGMTSWHFVLRKNTHTIVSLKVTFNDGVDDFELSLTPKTTAEWDTFDPTANYIAHPNGKHAYVYTGGDVTLVDAAAQDSPDAPESGPIMNLSHVCLGEGTSTDGDDGSDQSDNADNTDVDDGGDVGADDVGADDGPVDDGPVDDGPDVGGSTLGQTDGPEVEGNVDQLPRTGSEDRSLFILGVALVAAGVVTLVMKREVFIRS